MLIVALLAVPLVTGYLAWAIEKLSEAGRR